MATTLNADDLKLAARSAINSWKGSEGELARELQATSIITDDFLRRWLGLWMLARSNPKTHRTALAAFLSNAAKPRIAAASDAQLPALVCELAVEMFRLQATKGRQTSLMSKFAFSLRPEVIVPYDRRARLGLGDMFSQRLQDHDYPAYLHGFHAFAKEVAHALDRQQITQSMRADWEPVMSERLFKMRAADKHFMLLGGFSKERMARD
jgi:hypothetical protein